MAWRGRGRTGAARAGRRVLITGGLGFIGSNLAHRCVALGASVTIADISAPGSGANPANLAGIERHVRLVTDDIRSEAIVASVRAADIVFHCAAYTSHVGSLKDPRTAYDVNCNGVMNLLEAVRGADSQIRFVQLGTSTQIGRMQASPVTEAHPELPLDVYSATKVAAEKLALVYGTAYGIPVAAIRLANVYGPRAGVRDLGLGFLNYFIGLALQGKELTVYGEGAQVRTVTFIDDVVEALVRAAASSACVSQPLFAVADTRYSVRELAEAVARVIGGRIRFVPWPPERAAIEVGDAIISNRLIKELLDWEPATSLDAGLARTREYFESRIESYVR